MCYQQSICTTGILLLHSCKFRMVSCIADRFHSLKQTRRRRMQHTCCFANSVLGMGNTYTMPGTDPGKLSCLARFQSHFCQVLLWDPWPQLFRSRRQVSAWTPWEIRIQRFMKSEFFEQGWEFRSACLRLISLRRNTAQYCLDPRSLLGRKPSNRSSCRTLLTGQRLNRLVSSSCLCYDRTSYKLSRAAHKFHKLMALDTLARVCQSSRPHNWSCRSLTLGRRRGSWSHMTCTSICRLFSR